MLTALPAKSKFANFDALQNTLKISGQTGYPVNNTLYVVTLEDGVVKSGHIVTDGEQLKGYANYPLSSAYNTYSDITINIVEGAAGTVEMNYSDRDTFADSLYHDYSANKYYSVVTDLTKVVGTMGNPADPALLLCFYPEQRSAQRSGTAGLRLRQGQEWRRCSQRRYCYRRCPQR